MAFKIDFSKLDTSAPRQEESPYAMTDRFHFRDDNHQPRKIHTGTVEILLDERRGAKNADSFLGDQAYRARVTRDGKTRDITLVFKGQRADDLQEGRLLADHQEAHVARCDAGDWDRELSYTVEVEGAWLPVNWKDRDGKWQKAWEMLVARWTYRPADGSAPVVEGRLPEFDA